MLEQGGIALHNVVELAERPGEAGRQLLRFPAAARRALTERGRWVAQEAAGCEVRFVSDSHVVRVTVTARESDGRAIVSRGDYVHSVHPLPAGVTRTLHLERPTPVVGFSLPEFTGSGGFSPEVWRVCFDRSSVLFHGVEDFDHGLRAPRPDELPRLTWLAYGSSITHSSAYHGYPHHAARHLAADVLNLGLSGSCFAEAEVAEYIAGRPGWDFATFELGINMRGSVEPDEFARRARHLVTTVTERNPDKPVFLLTVFPNVMTFRPDTPEHARETAYNAALRDLAAEMSSVGRRVRLIEGSDVLTPLSCLSCDLLHPSEYGHAVMGQNLARLLAPHVADLPGREGGRG